MKHLLIKDGLKCTRPLLMALMVLLAGFSLSLAANPKSPKKKVDFNEFIQPILSTHCYKCHDGETQKGELRLDLAEAAFKGGKSGKPAFVPGKSHKSEAFRRILSNDPDEQMPPPDKGRSLTDQQIRILMAWINQGAEWPKDPSPSEREKK